MAKLTKKQMKLPKGLRDAIAKKGMRKKKKKKGGKKKRSRG